MSGNQFQNGVTGLVIGLILIFLTLLILYGTYLGVVGCISLVYSMILIWGVFNTLGLVVNLPGLAGIILTIGISVDSFILIFENIKEVIRERISRNLEPYDEETIWQILSKITGELFTLRVTTLVGATVLLFFSGPIKGFALTTLVGLGVSMFVASKYIIGGLLILTENTGKEVSFQTYGFPVFENPGIATFIRSFLQFKGKVVIISILLAFSSLVAIYLGKFNLNNDLRRGTELQLQIETNRSWEELNSSLSKTYDDLNLQLFSIQEINNVEADGLSVLLKSEPLDKGDLEKIGLSLQEEKISSNLISEWTTNPSVNSNTLIYWTIALLTSIALIFLWCLLPFSKVKIRNNRIAPASISVLAVVHDILLVILIISIFKIELSIPVITALLLLTGYSLNDSLVLIYRIKDSLKKRKNLNFSKLVDDAVISIRSRTLATTFTTIIGLMPVLFLRVNFITPFVITVIFGLIIGTYSSMLFVNPLLVKFIDPAGISDDDTAQKRRKRKEPRV